MKAIELVKGSMMRYLSLWAFRVGTCTVIYAGVMLTWGFWLGAMEWAGTFLAVFIAGIGIIGGGITGKAIQTRYENEHIPFEQTIEKLEKIADTNEAGK